MGKHKKWTLKKKKQILKEFKRGATISYLTNKYDILSFDTVSRWNKEYDEGRLGLDNHGKRKKGIHELKNEYFVTRICNVLEVNRRSYYKWCSVGKSLNNNFNIEDAKIILKEH